MNMNYMNLSLAWMGALNMALALSGCTNGIETGLSAPEGIPVTVFAEISPVTKSGEAISSDNGFDRTSFLSGDQIKVTRTKKASGTAASQSASYRYDGTSAWTVVGTSPVQYLYDSFSKLLRENNIKFIKWDMNKSLTDPGFPSAPSDEQRAVRIKYVENLYRLLETLRAEFPDVWFENCASGGGRVDLGMMARTDFSWASDNTDPVERTFIQYAFLNAFPSNSMISWVTHEDWHKQNHPLEFKFDVSMCGVLGVGYDITKWTDKEKAVAREKIARYKEIRETVHNGDLYRLVSPYENNRSVLQFVNKAKTEAVVFVYNLAEYPDNAILQTKRSKLIKLRGLQPEVSYKVEGIDGTYKGAQLMDIGIQFPVRGAFKSGIFKIVKQ